MSQKEKEWDLVVEPKGRLLEFNFKELSNYKDLLFLLVKRDFTSQFKQTLLGPILLIVQPLALALTYTFFFGHVAKISTNEIPRVLFYISGLTLWSYFAECLTKTSNIFVANSGIFGKVYFPRLIVPLSILFSNLPKLGVQFLLFFGFWLYYYTTQDTFHPHFGFIFLIPVLIILVAGLGLGFGLFISSLTTKYRDFTFFVGFAVQLMMYMSSVILPLSIFPIGIRKYLVFNPMCSIIEAFKYIFLGAGELNWLALSFALFFMIALLLISTALFNKTEKLFMDTV